MSQESEFVCLNCGGQDFKRVSTEVKLGEKVISGLVDLQCKACGEIRPQGPLLPRIEAILQQQKKK